MDTLLEAMDEEAAGLAAIQIGVPRRIFLLRNGYDKKKERAENNVYINPVIISKSRELKNGTEACLSIPGMHASFKRPKQVTLEYFDLNGDLQRETFTGFWARAVMHEMDHLDGRLITVHLEKTLAKRQKRTKFKMILDQAATNRIRKRRAKNKRARKMRQRTR
jgi:peptide deformylase